MVDAEREGDEPPFRIQSGNINSPQYHRAVYNCLKGTFVTIIDLTKRNHHELFIARKKNNWLGKDSLYDAWLLSKYGKCQSGFDMGKFER